jgi:hypothetical protein
VPLYSLLGAPLVICAHGMVVDVPVAIRHTAVLGITFSTGISAFSTNIFKLTVCFYVYCTISLHNRPRPCQVQLPEREFTAVVRTCNVSGAQCWVGRYMYVMGSKILFWLRLL